LEAAKGGNVSKRTKKEKKKKKKKKNDQLTRNSTDDQRGREDEKERHKDACKARLWHALQIHAHRALLDFRHCNRRTVSPTTPRHYWCSRESAHACYCF
jgi:hypothetical protein